MTIESKAPVFREVVRSLEDYALVIDTDSGERKYQIINMETRVVEHEPTVLAVAHDVLETLQASLDAYRDEKDSDRNFSYLLSGLTESH